MARGSEENERKRAGEGHARREAERAGKKEKAAGGRADRDSHKIDSLCASPPRHHRRRLCLLSKLCSQFTSDQVSALRFYANPMPMSCRRRGEPPFTLGRDRRGFHFPRSVPFLPRQVCFKVTTFLLSSALAPFSRVYRSCISFRSPPSQFLSRACIYASLSLSLFPLLSSPLLPAGNFLLQPRRRCVPLPRDASKRIAQIGLRRITETKRVGCFCSPSAPDRQRIFTSGRYVSNMEFIPSHTIRLRCIFYCYLYLPGAFR